VYVYMTGMREIDRGCVNNDPEVHALVPRGVVASILYSPHGPLLTWQARLAT
jgi:hypothetical protein